MLTDRRTHMQKAARISSGTLLKGQLFQAHTLKKYFLKNGGRASLSTPLVLQSQKDQQRFPHIHLRI